MSYTSEVAELFLARFPHIQILSADDYVLIAEWEKEEIPIDLIREIFNQAAEQSALPVNSVRDLEEAVEAGFQTWLQRG